MLRKIKRFFVVNNLERSLFIQAFVICGYYRLLVFFAPMRYYIKRLGAKGVESPFLSIDDKSNEIKQVMKSIRRALRFLPGTTKCLAKAISAKLMLRRRGIVSTIYLGVAKEGNEKLIAHAWLRCGDMIVTGAEEKDKFTAVVWFT